MNEQWYQNRDKRTDNCDGVNTSYKNASVCIKVFENMEEYRVQLLTYFTIKILVKWCRNINLISSETNSLLSKNPERFGVFLQKEIMQSDPHCSFQINKEEKCKVADIHLLIGKPPDDVTHDYVSVNTSGWIATCGFNQHAAIPEKIIPDCFMGTAFGACLANAELFRYLIKEKSYPHTKWYSLWSNEVFDHLPPEEKFGKEISGLDFGRIHLIGCGAIGSSFAFLFPYSKCKAEFLLVDPDEVEDHNTSSSLLFNFNDAATQQVKVEVCSDYFKQHGIYTEKIRDDYGKFKYVSKSEDLKAADIILCFANENNIWSTIQNQYPPMCFHATTSKSWGINVGRHIPLVDNCIMCTFKEMMNVNYVPVCGGAEIKVAVEKDKPETHTAILPFLAPAAALITLCELYKTVSGIKKKENSVIFNMQSSDGTFVGEEGEFGDCYICKGQTESLYKRFCEHTKFWNFSLTA